MIMWLPAGMAVNEEDHDFGSSWRKIFHFALDSAALWIVASVAIGMVASLLPTCAATGLTVRNALAYESQHVKHSVGRLYPNRTRNALLSYETAGTGHLLLLIHGALVSRRVWRDQIAEFSKTYQVVAPDLPAHGDLPKAIGPYTVARLADAIIDLLDFLQGRTGPCVRGLPGWNGRTAIGYFSPRTHS
jgi:hypothetical protein